MASDAKAAVQRAEADVADAKAAVQRAEAAVQRAEADVADAEAAVLRDGTPFLLAMYQSTQATLQSAQASVQSAQATLQAAIKRVNDLEASRSAGESQAWASLTPSSVSDEAVFDDLVCPFTMDEMCCSLDIAVLESLLKAPLRRKVPVLDKSLISEFPDVFEQDTGERYPPATYVFAAFSRSVTFKGCAEVAFVANLVERLRHVLDVPVSVSGNQKEDPSFSVCTAGSRSDLLMIHYGTALAPVFHAEYTDEKLKNALHDMKRKHRGSTAGVYGDLDFIFGYGADGENVQFMVIPLDSTREAENVLRKLSMHRKKDRQTFMIAMVNIFRWIRALNEQDILCSTGLAMLQNHVRASPWKDLDGSEAVTVNIGLNHVRKEFRIPDTAFAGFEKLYSHLMEGITGAIHASSVIVDGRPLFEQAPPKKPYRRCNPSFGWRNIELHLTPVGCQVDAYMGEEEVVHMVGTLLQCLQELHRLRFCHYDIRLPNVMRYKKKFILFDFEIAGITGSQVPHCFASGFWKQGLNRVYEEKNDLYMLGKHVIGKCINSPAWLKELGSSLETGQISTAEEALRSQLFGMET